MRNSEPGLFLPAAGYRPDTYMERPGQVGHYWTSTLDASPYCGVTFSFGSSSAAIQQANRSTGHTIRPVCILK